MKRVLLMMGLVVFLVGCSSIKQAVTDYNTGKASDSAGDVKAQASQEGQIIAALPVPYAAPIGAVVTFLVGIFLFWKRGVTIRKTGAAPVSSTGFSLFNTFEQFLANVAAGVFTTSTGAPTATTGILQRVWKAVVASSGSLLVAILADPSFLGFIQSHPLFGPGLVAAISGILGIEKGLSNVPVAPSKVA